MISFQYPSTTSGAPSNTDSISENGAPVPSNTTNSEQCAMRSQRRPRRRSGNSAVELAITLPLMMTIVFGSVEVCQLIHSRQAIEAAAYQCALIAIDSEGTDVDVQARMNEILTQRGVLSGSVVTTPLSIEGLPRGSNISVVVTAPFADNTWVPVRFVGAANIESRCVMLKEI